MFISNVRPLFFQIAQEFIVRPKQTPWSFEEEGSELGKLIRNRYFYEHPPIRIFVLDLCDLHPEEPYMRP